MSRDLKQAIVHEARRLGFALAGFTSPAPPDHLEVHRDWLSHGYHGGMAYLGDPRRGDPRLLLPECRSILVLATRHANPNHTPQREPVPARIAAYAWGTDYHLILPERMQALVDFIEKQAGHAVPSRSYTDSGPLLERDLAQRAGLGWIGRNTCLIHPALGSFFLLSEILLGVEIEADVPFPFDRCGNCTRCVDACPTGALLPDRTMDARRCIAYLTIENRAEIPPTLRDALGEWMFGCDACQVVCPWNRIGQSGGGTTLPCHPEIVSMDPRAEMALSPQEFKDKYKDSPLLRTRWNGYLRNTAVVLGNRGGTDSVQVLEQAVKSEDALVSEHAAWALEKIKRHENETAARHE